MNVVPIMTYHGRRPGLNKVRQRGVWGIFHPAEVWGAEGKGGPRAKSPEADAFL